MHGIPHEVFPIVFRWEFYVDNVFLEGIIDLILFIILWSCFTNPCMGLGVVSGKVHNLAKKIFLEKQCGFCSAEKIPEKTIDSYEWSSSCEGVQTDTFCEVLGIGGRVLGSHEQPTFEFFLNHQPISVGNSSRAHSHRGQLVWQQSSRD